MLLNDPKHYIEKALLALERSKAFTYEKFSERLYKLLDPIVYTILKEGGSNYDYIIYSKM
jgi:hypothetical protein